MMQLIESAPRKLGAGVNKEFFEFFSKEIELISEENWKLLLLDELQKEDFVKYELF